MSGNCFVEYKKGGGEGGREEKEKQKKGIYDTPISQLKKIKQHSLLFKVHIFKCTVIFFFLFFLLATLHFFFFRCTWNTKQEKGCIWCEREVGVREGVHNQTKETSAA